MIKNILKHKLFLTFIGFLAVVFLVFLLISILRYEEKIEKSMFEVSTSDLFQITQNKASDIKSKLEKSNNYIDSLKSNTSLREEIESSVKTILTDNIKYAYILYKDKNDIFRFLIDASPEHEKSMINQKFDIASKKWLEIYKTKKPVVIKQELLKKLSISYLVPILNKDEVELVFAIDFSVEKMSGIKDIIVMMKTGVILILLITFISLITFIFQVFRYKKIKKSSFIDSLTNVYNRNYLEHIQNKLDLNDYVLALLDIDFFKNVNDTYGHDVGDNVLRKLGDVLKTTLREDDDIAIRYGGEEFIVLVKVTSSDQKNYLSVINRIFETVKAHKFYADNNFFQITLSIGVNENPAEYKNFSEAFKATDKVLYEVKNSGRNNIKYF
jgi:diguanylate cyclase (GGDEF)-like protein